MKNIIKNHVLVLAVLFLASVLLDGCRRAPVAASSSPSPAVQVVRLKNGPITRRVTLPAQIRAYQEAVLYAKVAGYLKTLAVDKGDRVTEGDFIAEIEVPEIIADQARNKAEVEVAEINYRRLRASQQRSPDLVVPLTVDEAKAQLDVARANLERTETFLKYARVTAPFSGIVTRRLVDPGAFIPAATSASAARDAAIVAMADLSLLRIQTFVPENEAAFITTNQPVTFTCEGLPGRVFEGSVTRYAYALDDETRTMLTEIEVPNPSLELRPGMYVIATIGIERKDNALLAPLAAVSIEKEDTFVFVMENNKARKVKVKTGFNDGVNVEIVNGLAPGQAVILPGKYYLNDGQEIKAGEIK